ncbi:MAG: hypothetical protein PHD43_08230 [Methylococcales bacterium]|nr:hypothetical protein [Methylococcales bacterium]
MKITHMKTIGSLAILALFICSSGAYAEETKEETHMNKDQIKGHVDEARSADSADKQSEAFNICIRATQRFEQQEMAKETGKTAVASLTDSCKMDLKPLTYWLCMDKEANEQVDFNVAHKHCSKKTN